MDIGVASVRNIYKIHWRRSLLWGLLALSSVPIHLLYNSAIFKTLAVNEYTYSVVNADFLQGSAFAPSWGDGRGGHYTVSQAGIAAVQKIQHSFTNGTASTVANIQRLDNSECIAAYGTSFVSGRTNVLAITSAVGTQTNNTVFLHDSVDYRLEDLTSGLTPSFNWICHDVSSVYWSGHPCDIAATRRNAGNWTKDGRKIDYCLSEVVPSKCKLQFSVYILVTVILMNAGKSLAMFLTLYTERDPTLVTIGMKCARSTIRDMR